jgi:hypothetical protein
VVVVSGQSPQGGDGAACSFFLPTSHARPLLPFFCSAAIAGGGTEVARQRQRPCRCHGSGSGGDGGGDGLGHAGRFSGDGPPPIRSGGSNGGVLGLSRVKRISSLDSVNSFNESNPVRFGQTWKKVSMRKGHFRICKCARRRVWQNKCSCDRRASAPVKDSEDAI